MLKTFRKIEDLIAVGIVLVSNAQEACFGWLCGRHQELPAFNMPIPKLQRDFAILKLDNGNLGEALNICTA